MIKLCQIDQTLEQAWENLVKDNFATGFMQNFFWSDFKQKTGWDADKIGILEDDVLVGGAIVLKLSFSKDKNFLYIPEGPVLAYQSAKAEEYFHALLGEIDEIADLVGDQRTTHIRLDPRLFEVPTFFHKLEKAPYNMEPTNTLMLNLTLSEADLLAQMKPKARYNIKVAERHGVTVAEDSSDEGIENFLKLYNATVERNKFDSKGPKYFYTLVSHLRERKQGTLFFAYYQGMPIATALVVFYGQRATYFFGGSNRDFPQVMAPYKLHFEIMKQSKSQGHKWYDFWGVAPRQADHTHHWANISDFKRKFGGEEFTFIGSYDFIYNHKLYQEFLKESEEI